MGVWGDITGSDSFSQVRSGLVVWREICVWVIMCPRVSQPKNPWSSPCSMCCRSYPSLQQAS